MKEEMIYFLSTHLHNFVWRTQDMPRISPNVAEHKLNINPTFKLVKQKPRQFGEDKLKGMRAEIEKLLESKFICEVEYP